jgi:hypothetical protein
MKIQAGGSSVGRRMGTPFHVPTLECCGWSNLVYYCCRGSHERSVLEAFCLDGIWKFGYIKNICGARVLFSDMHVATINDSRRTMADVSLIQEGDAIYAINAESRWH